jgi:hypothetical protein
MFKIVSKAAILTGMIVAPSAAWSPAMRFPVQVSPAPPQIPKAASKDDRSYLPPWMRDEKVAINAPAQVVRQVPDQGDRPLVRRTRTAHRRAKRERRYAQASGWGLFRGFSGD